MTIEQSGVVDMISISADQKTARLIITDHLEWSTKQSDHRLLLQNKINEYLNFIEEGTLLEARPDLQGMKLAIEVVGKYIPDLDGEKFLNQVVKKLDEDGYKFTFRLFEGG
ncbi:DUF6572 domain-containing protein [Pseudomonas putida]